MSHFGVPDATGMRSVDMDPALANSVGLHHTIPTAVADLVDNSLDARAGAIRVRFLLDGSTPIGMQVIDNGWGMDASKLDDALTYSGAREHSEFDLGHFGIGMKAASLSQADTVLICSRAPASTPAGRILLRSGDRSAPRVGEIGADAAAARLETAGINGHPGTVIEWRAVRNFPSTSDPAEQRRWLEGTIREVRAHLGLVLHRILERDNVSISVDTWDIATGTAGPTRAVEPIDPFGYHNSGDRDFPQELEIQMPGKSHPVRATAHVWPPRSQDPGFKIGGEPGEESQGFFVYRNDRLLQAGGWCGLWGPRSDWGLARVALDLNSETGHHVTINPEKSGITFSSDLRRALETSTTRGTGLGFVDFLAIAAGEERRGRSRVRRPVQLVEPRLGISFAIRDAYREAVDFDPDADSVDIRWRTLPRDQVFRIDRVERVLALNLRYREGLVGKRSQQMNDVPVLKVLLHLLLQKYFEGIHLGDRDKREINAWQRILLVAVREQVATQEQP
jgi:Histidine kinase-, DNA gyrase B-, and HSP90-like ATPase